MVNLGPLKNITDLGDECDFLNNWQHIISENVIIESKLLNRINYIIEVICHQFDTGVNVAKLHDITYLANSKENENYCYECGGPDRTLYDYFIEIFTDSNIKFIKLDFMHNVPKFFIYYEDKVINLIEKFPKSWIFNDFEEELKAGKQAYANFLSKKELEKINKKQNKVNDKSKKILLQESLKAKLTPEELELISFKNR